MVNETFPVTFTCTATGIPPPTIEWMREGEMLTNTSLGSRLTLGDASVTDTPGNVSEVTRMLTISNAMDDDSENYTCEANNDAEGGKDSEEFELLVQSESACLVVPILSCVFIFSYHALQCCKV